MLSICWLSVWMSYSVPFCGCLFLLLFFSLCIFFTFFFFFYQSVHVDCVFAVATNRGIKCRRTRILATSKWFTSRYAYSKSSCRNQWTFAKQGTCEIYRSLFRSAPKLLVCVSHKTLCFYESYSSLFLWVVQLSAYVSHTAPLFLCYNSLFLWVTGHAPGLCFHESPARCFDYLSHVALCFYRAILCLVSNMHHTASSLCLYETCSPLFMSRFWMINRFCVWKKYSL